MSTKQTWRTRSLSLVLISALMMVSCTSFKVVKPDDIQAGLKAGDTVKIITKDGRTLELTIVTITPEALVGDDQRVEFADIRRLEKREISAATTAGVGLAGAIMVALAMFGWLAVLAVVVPAWILTGAH